MYTPKRFKIDDSETIRSFIEEHSFGILISSHDGQIDSTHTPMYLSEDMKYVYGHIARANRQWRSWATNSAVRVMFHGPHTYISPTDYISTFNVPTWNYTAISIDGTIEILAAQQEQQQVIEELIDHYESARKTPWRLDTSNNKLMRLLNAIVCFRIEIEQIHAQFKLNQNKSLEDQHNVVEQLRKRGGDMNLAIADLMAHNLN